MAVKINAKKIAICENCSVPFDDGDFVITIHNFKAKMNEIKISGIGCLRFPLDSDACSHGLYVFHKTCVPNNIPSDETSTPSDLKEYMGKLNSKQRRELYVFLHDAYGCRI